MNVLRALSHRGKAAVNLIVRIIAQEDVRQVAPEIGSRLAPATNRLELGRIQEQFHFREVQEEIFQLFQMFQ
jgi:hypothetical protein